MINFPHCVRRALFFRIHRFQSIAKNMEKLPKVFVNHVQEEDLMKVSFVYGDETFPEREFNFVRSKMETLDSALKRMKFKVEGAISHKHMKKHKKKQEEPVETVCLDLHVVHDGLKVDGETPNTNAWVQGAQLVINDYVYEVIENAPAVSCLKLPKNIMSGFPVYPKLGFEFATKEDSAYLWYRLITESEKSQANDKCVIERKKQLWLKISEDFIYRTTMEDIDHKLMVVCVPKLGDRNGKEEEEVSTNTVLPGPEKCPFEDRHKYTDFLVDNGSFRCVSYNILADLYANTDTARNDLFHHCPTEYLDLEYRRQLYLKELLGYNGDLLCLQEVDRRVFHDDLLPVLSVSGLEGIYNGKGNQVAEGLAFFYRTSKFRVVESEIVILGEIVSKSALFDDIWQKMEENEKLKERIINRTTALQIVVLQCLDSPEKYLLVGNTHLYFHPDSDNIRLIQAAICIRHLELAKRTFEENNSSSKTALIFSGDFNSCPEFGVLNLVRNGHLSEDCIDWKSNPDEAVDGIPLQHSLSLDTACGTPSYTNYTEGFYGCLDYIFYEKSLLSVENVVPLPSHEQVTQLVALPNKLFPSDHMALVCTLTWS